MLLSLLFKRLIIPKNLKKVLIILKIKKYLVVNFQQGVSQLSSQKGKNKLEIILVFLFISMYTLRKFYALQFRQYVMESCVNYLKFKIKMNRLRNINFFECNSSHVIFIGHNTGYFY